jgi:LPXTG-motif cell wall-anchored protein
MFGSWKRAMRGAAALAVIAGGLVLTQAAAAHAAVAVTPTCTPYTADSNGQPTGAPLGDPVALTALNLPNLGSGTVTTGTVLPVKTVGTTSTLPASASVTVGGTTVSVTVVEIKNITLHFAVSGAAALSKPTLSGGNAIGATASSTATGLTLTMPGSKTGSVAPGGNAFFPGGSKLTTPTMSLKVTAPDSPGTITTSLTTMSLVTRILLGQTALNVYLDCTAPKNTLGTVNVVLAGAPVAVDDTATTSAGKAVTIDVLANDQANDKGQPPDPSTLSIVKNPQHGSATVTTDHKVLYTPASGFTGTDTFQYQVCDNVAPPTTTTSSTTTTTVEAPVSPRRAAAAPKPAAESTLKCDSATVTISVESGTVSTQGSTATTVAAAQLPRTGSTSVPIVLLGGGLCVAGLAALGATRRRARD